MATQTRHEKFASMGYRGATSRKAQATRTYPLRRVVDEAATKEVAGYTVRCWELKCGHKVRPPKDLIGPRYPSRMRCAQCAKEAAKT